jgi:drug/metabolite transporter (DMT)-like permease
MFLVFLLYGLFATVFIVCKFALGYSPPLFLVGARMALAGVLLLAYVLWRDRRNGFKILRIPTKAIYPLISLAFFNIYLTNVCEVWGLQYLSSAKTCFIYSLAPFASALISFAMFSERLSQFKWIGLLVGFIGYMPIMLDQSSTEELTGSFGFFSWAELAVCVAAVSSVYGWILLKQAIQEHHLSPLQANGVSMLLGGLMALGHSYYAEPWDPVPVTEYLPFIAYSVLLIIVSNLMCYNLYGWLLKKYTATFMSFAGFTTPVFTAILGWVFFNETISVAFCCSMGVVFGGLFLFYREELKQGYVVAT